MNCIDLAFGDLIFPNEVVQNIIFFTKPPDLRQWLLVSKKCHLLATTIIFLTSPQFIKRQVNDRSTLTILNNIHKNFYHYQTVPCTNIDISSDLGVFLGKVDKYFIFQKSDQEIIRCCLEPKDNVFSEITKIDTRSFWNTNATITYVECSDDYFLVGYSDVRIELFKGRSFEKKILFQISPSDELFGKIIVQCFEEYSFFLINNYLSRFCNVGSENRIIFIKCEKYLQVDIYPHNCSMRDIRNGHCSARISAFVKYNDTTCVIATSDGQFFLWDIYKSKTSNLICHIKNCTIKRIDCDSSLNPDYIVVSTERSIICIQISNGKYIARNFRGSNVLSISFQKNVFFVGTKQGRIFKCEVLNDFSIPIYKPEKLVSPLVRLPQAWASSKLYFSQKINNIKAIEFSNHNI